MAPSVLDRRACDRARLARDARFDGRFFIAVTTTGIYCRPICPAPSPRPAHIRYYASAAAAAEAGFRPCLRCRPEAAPGTPAWHGTSAIVGRALRLIGEGACTDGGVDRLAERLGIGPRHLHRLFVQHVGAPPVAVLQTWRLGFAKRLLDETSLPISQVALVAGFGSIRRFNDAFRHTFHRPPSQVRRRPALGASGRERPYSLTLAYRPPYDWDGLFEFLALRATPGVEQVEGRIYRRTIAHRGSHGLLEVQPLLRAHALRVAIRFPDPGALPHIVARVRAMFDLAADPGAIGSALGRDPLLGALVRRRPGVRVPAAWDPFELAVRAIVGQQVTVRAATTLMGRLVARLGQPIETAEMGEGYVFPTPTQLAIASTADLGVTAARADAIRAVARGVVDGAVRFDTEVETVHVVRVLTALPGIGDWTANYVAMRGLSDPDAFPVGDLGLRIAAGDGRRLSSGELAERAEAWRPWRAYAAMHLWHFLAHPAADRPQPRQPSEAPTARPSARGSPHEDHVVLLHGQPHRAPADRRRTRRALDHPLRERTTSASTRPGLGS